MQLGEETTLLLPPLRSVDARRLHRVTQLCVSESTHSVDGRALP